VSINDRSTGDPPTDDPSTKEGTYGDPATRQRILVIAQELIAERGSGLKLSDVAAAAGVSRQAIYLHFGDRNGLLLAVVHHIDDTLALDVSIAHVLAASTGSELLERAMWLNTEFWTAVRPVAQVLQGAQYDDEALGAAWRDRMDLRQTVFRLMVQQLADRGELDEVWGIDDAASMLYSVAHFDAWRELTGRLGWTDAHYVATMTRLLCRSLLTGR
jgi:AcrR family transcriptional regulator